MHDVGGLVYYDGANLNAILGRSRPGDMGFDIVHINTHKTFATPHGGGGPGAGPVGVVERARAVPAGAARRARRRTARSGCRTTTPRSIGRVHGFHGNFGVLVRAYAYVFFHGARRAPRGERAGGAERELPRLGHRAKTSRSRTPTAARCTSSSPPRRALEREAGVRAMDVAKRVIDLGYHPSTVYFPLVVEEAMMVEPTETESKETLDGFAAAMRQAAAEARSDPDLLHEAPVTTPVRRLDEARAARHLRLTWRDDRSGND